jgi:hypothetical protein
MAINPLLFSAGATQAAQTPQTQPMTPEQAYLENMRKISSGDLKSLLTGGDRLLALSALLGSVARGSRTTPQEAMAQVQQTAANRVNMQMQMAQLQAKAAQEQRQKAFIQQYSQSLPEDKRGVLENADTAEAFKLVQQEAFRPKQVMKYVRDAASGKMRIEFQDGSSQLTDRDIPRNTDERDIGGAIQVIDKDTGEVVATVPKTMSPGEAARLNLAERQFAFQRSRPQGGGGGGGGGTLPEPKVVNINGRPTMMQWDKRAQRYVPFTGQNIQPAKVDPLAGILSGGTTGPIFGGR